MLTCLTDSKKIRLLSCRLTTLPQIVSQCSLLWQNVQESNHSTHFLLVHPLSKAELLFFFFPLFFFKFRQKIDYLRGRWLRPVNAVTKEETVSAGIIFGSPLSLQIPRFGVVLSYFFFLLTSPLIFFHLFEHCSPATLTNDLAFNCSPTLSLATFFRTLLLSKRSVFSSRLKEINSLVLFDDHVISFSPFSSSAMK